MDYEKRICCFIDVLGFKSAIKDSCEREDVRGRLFKIISTLVDQVKDSIADMIPYHPLGGIDITLEDKKKAAFENSSFVLTQFSDCFVISSRADNALGCDYLLRAIYIICLDFFLYLELMTRGGVAVGDLIHTESGVLFGPAMNEAYELESKYAIYPRVIFSDEAKCLIDERIKGSSVMIPLEKSFDGYDFVDMVSMLNFDYFKGIGDGRLLGDLNEWIDGVEKNVLASEKKAHPKIAYLKDRWKNRNIDS